MGDFTINGHTISPAKVHFEKHRIYIPTDLLDPQAKNEVSIKFENSYTTNGVGFHKAVDPVDQEVYLYTELEPFYCHRWFPCFDQPSIRAPLTMSVLVDDPSMKVVGNESQAEEMNWYSDKFHDTCEQSSAFDLAQ